MEEMMGPDGKPVMGPDGKPAMRPRRPKFSIKGYTGAPMSVAGFYSPIIVDLAGLKAARGKIPILLDHDPSRIIGQTDGIAIDASGVSLTGVITGDDATSASVIGHARNGFEWQASIGANIVRQEFLKSGEKAVVNGREVAGPLLIARESRLFETSFVAIGADSQTSAAVAASQSLGTSSEGETTMQFNEWLAAKGFDPAALSDTQRAYLQAQFNEEAAAVLAARSGAAVSFDRKAGGAAQLHSTDLVFAKHDEEQKRRDKIVKLMDDACSERPELRAEFKRIADFALDSESKMDLRDYQLELLRLSRSIGSAPRRDGRAIAPPRVITAAICAGGKLHDVDKHFDQATLNAADDAYPHGLGLRDLLLMVARENGYTGQSSKDVDGILRAAFTRQPTTIRANDGFSTLSLPGILSNVANKFLMTGFNAVESSWRQIAKVRPANDFKSLTTYALTGGQEYEEVGPTGEIKHGTLGETSYSNRVKTYARMFAITYEDIRNDDLGALTEVPQKLGRGAALKLNRVFWTEFLDGLSTFFTSGRGNVVTGAGSTLTSAGLAAALTKFRKQTDPDGNPLAIEPRILLVPPEQEIAADQLMTSLIINTGGSSTTDQVPNRNVWANKFRTVVSTYLSNANIPNFSTAAWYLLADPMDLPVIEVAFLDGRETPIVENAEADFNVLGVQMRGFHRFGASKQEYRGAMRSAGS